MIHYIILSSLLSMIGGAIYFIFLQNRLAVLHAKYTLLIIILLTWLIPFLVPQLPHYTTAIEDQYLFDYSQYNQWNVVDIQDPKLLSCYTQATTDKEQCHCEIEQQSSILLYQSNPYYNFWISCKTPTFWFFMLIMSLFLLDFILKIISLLLLIRSSSKEKRKLAHTTFYILRPRYNLSLPISSFTLIRHYIICQASFEAAFTPKELNTILLHEVAHLRQRDTWQQFLLYTLRLFWWMQPMYYWFRRELNTLNEYVADDFAIQQTGKAKAYARILIKAKEIQLQAPQISLTFAFAQSLLQKRVLRTITPPPKQTKQTLWFSLGIIIASFWATSAFALPLLQQQNIAVRQYEVLQQENLSTGKITFCKSCLSQKLRKS